MTEHRIERIRLVNFHNFVDETIEIRDGGHLFLLGDNGSGKTTVLDAVHYVLSGGELELNAAARIGGRRDEGRTLQGIVLRQDFERGVRNEGGAIAYAAIELHDPGSGRTLSLGIGTEATTLDARVTRWGFIVPRPLADIPLLDAAEIPLDREGLRRVLGTNQVVVQLSAFRKELARRLFGSEAQYEDAVRFWGMAKAYREIVAGARDFGALFARLLPPPDTRVYDEILRAIRAIDDLDVALRDLDAQAAYVRGLVELQREISEAREAAARYRWLLCFREREETAAEAARANEEAAIGREQALRLASDAEAARLRLDRLSEVLRRAESDDVAGVLSAIRECESRHAELSVEADRAGQAAVAAQREYEAATRVATEYRAAFGTAAREVARELRAAAAEVVDLPGSLATIEHLAGELEQGPAQSGRLARLPDASAAVTVAEAAGHAANDAVIEARVAVRAADAMRRAAAEAVVGLEAAHEALPEVNGHAAARRALAAAGIAARTIYELVEPVPGAPAATLAAIEALVGDHVLGAFVVGGRDRERARALVATAAPEVRVVCAIDESARLPDWCAQVLGEHDGDGAAREARHVLAAELSQAPVFGPVAEPSNAGDLVLRGVGFRAGAAGPRLLGTEARRSAHAARLERAREELAAAERSCAAARERVRAAELALARSERLVVAVRAAGGPLLTAAWHDAASAERASELHRKAFTDAEERASDERERLAAIEGDLAALRARATGVDLEELERRLVALRASCEVARDEWQTLAERKGVAEESVRRAEALARDALARRDDLERTLADAEVGLRSCLDSLGSPHATASASDLAYYVRVTQRGDSFRGVDSLRLAIADKERAFEARADELERDGSRGVRCLAYAARFGLVYERARNHIEDRRGQAIAGVLAELERSLAEQRTVINDHTRTLMDTLVMGELARHLQGQIYHLSETIKGINRVLRGLRFGPSEYQFQVTPRADRAELVELVRRLSILDEDSRLRFRAWIDARLDELRGNDDEGVPPLLDYRQWFEFKLRMSTTDAEGVELTHRLRQVGSGGEQGVPNYLLVLALAKLMFDAAGAAVRPLLFDEAFYGIDAGRRDQLLRLATDLGIQLFVASPDQDGATPSVRAATTLFVVKDENHDVHLAPYHYWNRSRVAQRDLFGGSEVPADPALCRIGPTT